MTETCFFGINRRTNEPFVSRHRLSDYESLAQVEVEVSPEKLDAFMAMVVEHDMLDCLCALMESTRVRKLRHEGAAPLSKVWVTRRLQSASV